MKITSLSAAAALFTSVSIFAAPPALLQEETPSLFEFSQSEDSETFRQHFYNQSVDLFTNPDNLFLLSSMSSGSKVYRNLIPSYYVPTPVIKAANDFINEPNAFKQRKLYKSLSNAIETHKKESSIGELEGKDIYIEMPILGSMGFDFDRMSKTIILNKYSNDRDRHSARSNAIFNCYENETEAEHFVYRLKNFDFSRDFENIGKKPNPIFRNDVPHNLYGDLPIKLSTEFKSSAGKIGKYCGVEIKFGENAELAEKVEEAISTLPIKVKAVLTIGKNNRYLPDLRLKALVLYAQDTKTKEFNFLHEIDARGSYSDDILIDKILAEKTKALRDYSKSLRPKYGMEQYMALSSQHTKTITNLLNPQYFYKTNGNRYGHYINIKPLEDGYKLSLIKDNLKYHYLGSLQGDHFLFSLEKIEDTRNKSMVFDDFRSGSRIYPYVVIQAIPHYQNRSKYQVKSTMIGIDGAESIGDFLAHNQPINIK